MAHWLSFWNKDTRRRNEPLLQDDAVSAIYIPYGKQRVALGDVIYCVGLEAGGLRLITRLHAASLDDDLDHPRSIWVDDVEAKAVNADFHRVVPDEVVAPSGICTRTAQSTGFVVTIKAEFCLTRSRDGRASES